MELKHDDEKVNAEPMMQVFGYKHLPEHLQPRSQPFYELAAHIVSATPRNPERTAALRKLREAKDCAVTAHIWKD